MQDPMPQRVEKLVAASRKRRLLTAFGILAVLMMTPAALLIITTIASSAFSIDRVVLTPLPSPISDIYTLSIAINVGVGGIVGIVLLYGFVTKARRRKHNEPSDL